MENNEPEFPPITHVTFRIFAPALLPEDITKNLELTPDHIHHEGDYPRNNPKYSAYKHGMWLLKSKLSEDRPLEEHLNNLLTILESKGIYIKSLAKHATVDIGCALYSQNGFTISPQIMRRMADLEITFGGIVYP